MPISFLAADNGYTHVCAHRGYSMRFPENTICGFEAGKRAGATTCEIDVVLTRDGEAILSHDMTLDRTTDGHGFLGDYDYADLAKLDAAVNFKGRFPGVHMPTFKEAVLWAKANDIGLVVEMKERERQDALSKRIVEVLRETDGAGHCLILSFNHVDLLKIKQREPSLRTEAIVHARNVDLLGVLKACGAVSVSIELDMFDADESAALHEAGISNRLSMPRPEKLIPYWQHGRDYRKLIGTWLSAGLVDSISGDDVAFLRALVDEYPIKRARAPKPKRAA